MPEVADPPPPAAVLTDATPPPLQRESQDHIQALEPVNYGELVGRAMSHEEEGLSQLRRKAGDAGVVRFPEYDLVRVNRNHYFLYFYFSSITRVPSIDLSQRGFHSVGSSVI